MSYYKKKTRALLKTIMKYNIFIAVAAVLIVFFLVFISTPPDWLMTISLVISVCIVAFIIYAIVGIIYIAEILGYCIKSGASYLNDKLKGE